MIKQKLMTQKKNVWQCVLQYIIKNENYSKKKKSV